MNDNETPPKNATQLEIQQLKAEIQRLRGLLELHKIPYQPTPAAQSNESVTKFSSSEIKMSLFLSLFRGRTDVYATRWQNKAGKSGYSPVCLNEWVRNICSKPQGKCTTCNHKAYKRRSPGKVRFNNTQADFTASGIANTKSASMITLTSTSQYLKKCIIAGLMAMVG